MKDSSPALAHVAHLNDAIVWAERARYDDTTAEQCALLTVAHMLLLQARGYIVRALRAEPCAACAGTGIVVPLAPATPAHVETPPMMGIPAPFGAGCAGTGTRPPFPER